MKPFAATLVVRTAPTLRDFDNVPLGPRLQDALGVPVHVFNDANAAVVADVAAAANTGDAFWSPLRATVAAALLQDFITPRPRRQTAR